MTRLQVEVADFRDAASTMRHHVAEAVRISLDGLDGRLLGELVGDDPAGAAWAAAYELAARSVLRATAQLVNAVGRTSLLLAHSGANYARAEAASDIHSDGDEPTYHELLQPMATVTAPAMPSAGGVGSGTPAGWWLIEHTIGVVWPGGHQDRLRATAQAWASAAGGLENVAIEPCLAGVAFARDHLPEADDVLTVCRGLNTRLDQLAHSYRALAHASNDYADHLDECHNAIRDELSDLIRDSVVTQGAGALLAIVSFGGSEAAAQTTQAARIATSGGRITLLIERLIAAAKRITLFAHRVQSVAEEVHETMTGLTGARVVYAGVTDARRTARAERLADDGRRTGKHLRMTNEAKKETGAGGGSVKGAGEKIPWTSWAHYPKVTRGGTTYAKVGDRLYARHAVDRLQPRGLGAPAGATGAGRSVSPTFVEHIIENVRSYETRGPLGELRLAYDAGDLRVVTENGIVITVMRIG